MFRPTPDSKQAEDAQNGKRKRIRIPKSCIPCLKGKRACDRERPACGRCARSGQPSECIYDARLDNKPPSGSSRNSKAIKRSSSSHDDESDEQEHPQRDEMASLRAQLQAAKQEARELQELIRSQQRYPSQPSLPLPQQPSSISSRKRALSRHSDLDAVTGLQMLAEMAGPALSGGDRADSGLSGGVAAGANSHHSMRSAHSRSESAAFYDRSKMSSIASVLNWPEEAPKRRLSPLSGNTGRTVATGMSTMSARSSTDNMGPAGAVAVAIGSLPGTASDPGLSPASDTRSQSSSATSPSLSPSSHLAESLSKDSASPINRNGAPIYYGASASSNLVLRQVKAEHTTGRSPEESRPLRPLSQQPGGTVSAEGQTNAIKKDVQTAFNGLLDPSRDSFPFATIWSSGDKFFDEVLPLFPTPDEFDGICQSFVRHFSAICPALTVPSAIQHAREFSRLSREQQAGVPLPWLSVFLMICAMGIDCDLENTIGSFERRTRNAQADNHHSTAPTSSAAASPGPGADEAEGDRARLVADKVRPCRLFSDVYLSATYQSLRLCSFLSSPTLQTIHAQLLIGSYLLNTERAASFWPLLGSIARQAQSIGLHVDPYKIRPGWDPIEVDIRRRLWWAIVHQDVILSSIFGRPLGITRFSTRFPTMAALPRERSFAALQCEMSQFARTFLDENQEQSWTQLQIDAFTDNVLSWYAEIPSRYRPDLGVMDPFECKGEEEAIRNFQVAGVDLNTKGLMEVHQSCNFAVEVHYILLSLHRANLLSKLQTDDDSGQGPAASQKGRAEFCSTPSHSDRSSGDESGRPTSSPADFDAGASADAHGDGQDSHVNEKSLRACARSLRAITRSQQTMTELLGRARASMFWKVSYYTYQAAVVGAYITFLRPNSRYAASALEDLGRLTDIFDRMPDRWTGLKIAKGALRVLYQLAVAARENPKAASMPKSAQTCPPVTVLTPLPIMAEYDPFGGPFCSTANTPNAGTTPSVLGVANGTGGSSGSSGGGPAQALFGSKFAGVGSSTPFILPIYQNSPGPARVGTPTAGASGFLPILSHPDQGARPVPFSIEDFFSDSSSVPMMGVPGTGWAKSSGNHDAMRLSDATSNGMGTGISMGLEPGRDSTMPSQSMPSTIAPHYHGRNELGSVGAVPEHTAQRAGLAEATQNSPELPSRSMDMPNSSSSVPFSGGGVGGSDPTTATTHAFEPAFSSMDFQPAAQHGAHQAAGAAVGGLGLSNSFGVGAGVPVLADRQDVGVQPNSKDIANYWSDYFSLQLDWDRLSALT